MNPDQNQYSIDYLNQIAAPPKKPGLDKKFLFMIGSGLLFAITLVILLVSLSGGSTSNSSKLQILSTRLDALSKVVSTAKKSIKSNQLRNTNANLTIFLTNATRDIEAPLETTGATKEKINKSLVAKYNGEKLQESLEDARLNATYDRVYAREMSYELETLQVLMKEIYQSSNNKSLKEYLATTEENLITIREQLAQYNETTS